MKKLLIGTMALSLFAASAASADPNDRDQKREHPGWGQDRGGDHQWRRGERVGYGDWQGARVVDYRRYHLRRPGRGYEWRESNGRYIMVAVATGLIVSTILSQGR
jgi:Ni/Co efflux regulator RcnB